MTGNNAVQAAIAALRSGRVVRISAALDHSVAAVETTTGALLELRDPERRSRLVMTGSRAAALNLVNDRDAADPRAPVILERTDWLDSASALALVDPGRDFDREPIGPLHPVAPKDPVLAGAALTLARWAGLLPALWLLEPEEADLVVSLEEIQKELRQPRLDLVARARLPLEDMPDTQILAFRASDDGQDHVALLVGAFGGRPPLVRLHSECLTGDVFGSLKCDCGPQLKEALRIIGNEGGGVLLYLRQEGRGIGLANKIRAYGLQDRGLDTVDANRRLGFADDERDYRHSAAILAALGIDSVRLLTNNPDKVAGLEDSGIRVIERVSHQMPANPHNADYLATKRGRSGHLLT